LISGVLQARAPVVDVDVAERPILMLVGANPDTDPRIGWVRDLCRQFGNIRIEGTMLDSTPPSRDYDGVVETNRFNGHALVGSLAGKLDQKLGWLYGLKAPPEGDAGAEPLRDRIRREAAAGGRFVADWSYYNLLIDSLYRQCRSLPVRPRLMICHDIYALAAAVRLKPILRCPILYDSHEFWPYAELRARPWEPKVISLLERRLLKHVDAVVTVSPPLARALERAYGLAEVHCVPNAEPWDESARAPTGVNRPVRFLLQGGAAPGRGFEQLLAGWRHVDPEQARLSIRCPESPYLADLRKEAAALVTSGAVEFLPAVTEAELVEAARFADVGVIPYLGPNLNHVYCCPNKLSQYMQAGLALLSNRLEFVERVIDDTEGGATYDADDPASVAAAVAALVADTDVLLDKKRRAYEAAKSWFNWEVQSEPYERAVRRLLAVSET
jgi:glycosyltransferase involved in cell wall biosynthesis